MDRDRGQRARALAAIVFAATAAGCVRSQMVECADGTLCPVDTICAPAGGSCATPEQVAECEGLAEGATCALAGIGDGLCRSGVCIVADCGDGVVDPEEGCDDGNKVGGDGCSADCSKLEACGDGVTDDGEGCDDGNANGADGCDACQRTTWVATPIVGNNRPAISLALGDPHQLAVDGQGRIYVADTAGHRIHRIENGIITTIAGTGTAGLPSTGPATSSPLSAPKGVAVDGLGRVYIADTSNHRIRRIDEFGKIATIAGTGTSGSGGNGGPALLAQLSFPQGLAVDGLGRVYVADTNNNQIRRIDEAGTISQVTSSIALVAPEGVAVAADGTVYVADTGNNAVRKITAGVTTSITGPWTRPTAVVIDGATLLVADTGTHTVRRVAATVDPVAGTGIPGFSGDNAAATSALLDTPTSVVVDAAGRIYIADAGNSRIRRIEATTISTVAGNGAFRFVGDGGAATSAAVGARGVAFDAMGRLVIADTTNHRIRRVDAEGVISTVVGTGEAGSTGDGGPALDGKLNAPEAIAIGADGQLYIADRGNNRIRKVDANGMITTIAAAASPVGVAVDSNGIVYFSELGNPVVSKLDGATVTAFAGGGADAGAGPIAALTAELFTPWGLAVDAMDRLYIADADGPRVVRVDAANMLTELIGSAGLISPQGLAVDATYVYIADTFGHTIQRTDLAGAGRVTLAGTTGTLGDRGDGALPAAALFRYPQAVAVQGGAIYVADRDNKRVRYLPPTGVVRTVVGGLAPQGYGPREQAELTDPRALVVASPFTLIAGGTSANVAALRMTPGVVESVIGRYPHSDATADLARYREQSFGLVDGVAYDAGDKTVYLAESTRHQVHAVAAGDSADANSWTIQALNTSTQPGHVDGALTGAAFSSPAGLYVDDATVVGRGIYVADRGNHAIRKIDRTAGTVETFAGTARTLGFQGDGGEAKRALLYNPSAVTRCKNGDLFIADTGNHRVRRVDGAAMITTVVGDGSPASSGHGTPARDFPVNAPLGVACDGAGNVFVTSTNTIRMLPADAAGVVDGSGEVQTIYGPSSSTPCLTGIAAVDATRIQVVDACAGVLLELERRPAQP